MMGGLFEVIIIERRASQRAESLGNKPAEPSDYQMGIYQRQPTLAGEDRAQADGPRKPPQAARQLTVPVRTQCGGVIVTGAAPSLINLATCQV